MIQVDIYTTRYCPYCTAAKRLLAKKGVKFTEIDVSGDANSRSRMVVRANGRMTVPQIFIGSVHIGGCDELYELDRAGNLDEMLSSGDNASGEQDTRA
jgi:glutaredoxin 3